MKQPVEIYEKKSQLFRIALVGLGLAALSVYTNIDDYQQLTTEVVLKGLTSFLCAIGGILALVRLLLDLFRKEAQLLIYDNRIEMYNAWRNRFSVIHFSDVVIIEKGNKKINFKLNPVLKKSDVSRRVRKWNKEISGFDFTLPISELNMEDEKIFQIVEDRFNAYKK
ncbi:MAG: hypothetical protein K6C10_07655 [Prevotella sp.]|nr:hypothetical protein [Prevotella sp.]